jgi:hypothetical protein
MPLAEIITGTMANDVLSSGSLSIVAIATGLFLAGGFLVGVVYENAGKLTGKTRGAPCNRG